MHTLGYGGAGSSKTPYQGYPYVNPPVIDAPSVDAATAAQYLHLPRRPVNQKTEEQTVVYIDLPSPEEEGSTVSLPNPNAAHSKKDLEPAPVVYVDVPDSGDSGVSDRRPAESSETSFVEETIFYDPFKNRRIDRPTSDSDNSDDDVTGSSISPPHTAPTLPTFMSKETLVYGSSYQLPTTSTSDFPEPPPAYSEREVPHGGPQEELESAASQTAEYPRTQVIVPESADRKVLYCMYCGTRGPTLVVTQSGAMTHVVACILFLLFFAMVLCVYCTDTFKYKNYYCKNCNRKIGREIPFLCIGLS